MPRALRTSCDRSERVSRTLDLRCRWYRPAGAGALGLGEIEGQLGDAFARRAARCPMLTALGRRTQRWVTSVDPWTNVYGLGRTILASSTALTLLFNNSNTLFAPLAGGLEPPLCTNALQQLATFCLVPSNMLEAGRWGSIAILVLVASGWRPRLTGLLHWWVSHSLFVSASNVDGGDQASVALTVLLLPLTLTDDRVWHWEAR